MIALLLIAWLATASYAADDSCPSFETAPITKPTSALLTAIVTGDIEAVRKLATIEDVNAVDESGNPPLIVALGSMAVLEPRGVTSEEARMKAIRRENARREQIVVNLLDAGAGADIRGAFGATPLIKLAHSSFDSEAQLRIANRLLQSGADLNARDVFGNSAVLVAQLRSKFRLVGLLVARGATTDGANCFGASFVETERPQP